MPYEIELTRDAEHHLAKLPLKVQRFVVRELEILGRYPTELSIPSHFPYRSHCQLFRVACLCDGGRWEMFALFQYSQDEQTLYIIGICFSRIPMSDDFDDDFHRID